MPVRHPDQDPTDYILSMREVFPPLFDQGYVVTGVASDYDKGTGNVSQAWFILQK